ncbi:hypothetical protein DMB83_012245 [Pectobacterium aquaticum]|nr:hypothetical protein DMB83_012245 [Pectobacterium aquaticum]
MTRWEQIMKRISPERKAVALAKLLPPYNITVTAVAQMEGISEATLYYWRNKAKAEGGKCWSHPPVLHADNGAAMKSQTLQMKLHELSITPSHCRPRVSNDNAYVESLFRTLKYVPQWPSSGFGTLTEAREWVEDFTQWYNETHRHSGIRYVTLRQRHRGEDGELPSVSA